MRASRLITVALISLLTLAMSIASPTLAASKPTTQPKESSKNNKAAIQRNARRQMAKMRRIMSLNREAIEHFNAGRFDRCKKSLEEILKLDPNREQEYFNRGMCRYWLGDLASSHADMREFLRRTPLQFGAEQVERALDIVSEYESQAGRRRG
mgnify:CR=1 FL=1